MKHNQSIKGRALYTITLLLLYMIIGDSFDLKIDIMFYSIFPIMIFSYYIFDAFSLNKKYRYREIIITGIINGFIFYMLAIYYKNMRLVFGWMLYTIAHNLIKQLYSSIFMVNEKIVIIGEERSGELEKIIDKNEQLSYVGCVGMNELEKIKNMNPNEVIYPTGMENIILEEIFNLKMSGVKVRDSMRFIQEVEGKVDVDRVSKKWVVDSKGFEVLSSGIEQRVKRFLDLGMSLIILFIGVPFMIFTYFLVKLDNPKNFIKNPAFFKQKRIGAGGKEFEILKFRSMRLHNPKEYSKYASEKDNRITKVGKFIRKTRLDELPQIFNVLKGDMSFVGPRPEWDELGREYENKINMYKLRYAVKPGLTGWAQVMYPYGANLDDAKKKLEYDIYYIKHQNFIMDMTILFKTVKVVLFGKGM